MKHTRCITRTPMAATSGLTFAEQAVILLLGIFFGDWQNYSQVVENLQKYYRKT